MEYDPGWAVCQSCGRPLRRYELACVERADGSRSVASIADLDLRARRGVARVWHEGCAARGQAAAGHARRTAHARHERRSRSR